MRSLRIGSTLAIAAFVMTATAFAATGPGIGNSGIGNLGDGLLDKDLAKSLSPAADKQGADWLPDQEMLKRLLQDGARDTAGEDVGGSPLASVVSGMRRAESFIRDDADNKAAVPVQKQVVAELDKLIAQMEKQCQSCKKSGKKSGQKKQASKRSQPKPSECKDGECDKEGQCDKPGSKPGKKPGQKANQSGTTSLAGAPNAATPEEQQRLMKAAWGHLPERMRERMLQGAGSEFLPEYRDELQQYYRKLAERTAQESP